MQPVEWLNLPCDIYSVLLAKFTPAQLLVLRKVCHAWLTFIDGYDSYWSHECKIRYGKCKELLDFVEDKEHSSYKIFSRIHGNFYNFLSHSLEFQSTLFNGYVREMIFSAASAGQKELYCIGSERMIKKIAFKNLSETTVSDIGQIPPSHSPVCLRKAGALLFIGTAQGMVYLCDLAAAIPTVQEVGHTKLPGAILHLEVCQRNKLRYAVVCFVEGDQLGKTSTWVVELDLRKLKNQVLYMYQGCKDFRYKPQCIGEQLLIAPLREGGLCLWNLKTNMSLELRLRRYKTDKQPIVNIACILSDRVIFGTEDGRIGWFYIAGLETLEFAVHWCKEFDNFFYFYRKRLEDITPIGNLGFCVHYEGGVCYPVIQNLRDQYIIGAPYKKAMGCPIWLDDSQVIFIDEFNPHAGIQCLKCVHQDQSLIRKISDLFKFQ